jgi:hypothetical protein
MKVTQEEDRVPGMGVLAAVACLVTISTMGVLGAYFIANWSIAELARAQRLPLYIESLPQAAPGAVPGRVPEEVNQIEQVLFSDRAPGLEERAYEHTLLRGYGWVDRDARLVRIPIDRAIELYVRRHREEQP